MTRGEGGWTVEEFHAELARFEEELKAPGIAPNTVHRYADRSGSRVQQLLEELGRARLVVGAETRPAKI